MVDCDLVVEGRSVATTGSVSTMDMADHDGRPIRAHAENYRMIGRMAHRLDSVQHPSIVPVHHD